MTGFLGEYESTLDAKGRFLFPAAFRKQLPDSESVAEGSPFTQSFVINRGFEKCLTLYPIQSWQPIFEKISGLNDFDPKVRSFRRYFLNGAITVEPDSAGRLLIPKNLSEYAGLTKDMVLASAVNKIEIWDKNQYQQFFESYSPESFSDLANQVMGGNAWAEIGNKNG
ncbi:MAG: division/cell wall cluster transcriptional repressor MraZ [Chitinophagaceae bacterium]|jgi:MraZ protein|nr:MAG: division/cell wall cluster transcriptional repressor MraZ [Chitinophagaceae bacterium]